MNRMNLAHQVEFLLPSAWNVSTQLALQDVQKRKIVDCTYLLQNIDALLDGIAECNENEIHQFTVDGRHHSLHYWDAGGHAPNQVMLNDLLRI